MKISILATVYNEEIYISDFINSIINQSYKNWELIIVNDGSTDGTQNIIDSYSDDRIISVKNALNKGKCYSQNVAYSKSSGDYCCLHGGDDWSSEDRLLNIFKSRQEMIAQGVTHEKLCFHTRLMHFKEGTGDYNEPKYPNLTHVDHLSLFKGFSIPSVQLVFPRCIADMCYPIPEHLDYEDRWIVFHVLFHADALISVSGGTYIYRLHDNNTWYSRPKASFLERYRKQKYLVERDHDVFKELSLLFSGDASDVLLNESLARKLWTCILFDSTIQVRLSRKLTLLTLRMKLRSKILIKALLSK